jgi:hypothetical protein
MWFVISFEVAAGSDRELRRMPIRTTNVRLVLALCESTPLQISKVWRPADRQSTVDDDAARSRIAGASIRVVAVLTVAAEELLSALRAVEREVAHRAALAVGRLISAGVTGRHGHLRCSW